MTFLIYSTELYLAGQRYSLSLQYAYGAVVRTLSLESYLFNFKLPFCKLQTLMLIFIASFMCVSTYSFSLKLCYDSLET